MLDRKIHVLTARNPLMKNEDDHRRLTFFALRMAGDIIASIAVPAVVLVWIARRLDARAAGAKPYFTIIAMLVSFVISTVIVCIKAVKYGSAYERLTSGGEERGPPNEPDSYG